MASNKQRKPRKHKFYESDVKAMADAGCKTGAENMAIGRAPSGKDIRSLALTNSGAAARITKMIQGDGVEQEEFAGV